MVRLRAIFRSLPRTRAGFPFPPGGVLTIIGGNPGSVRSGGCPGSGPVPGPRDSGGAPMVGRIEASRDLLLGLYALESRAIDREQLVDAVRAWTLSPDRTLSEVLDGLGGL